MGDLAISNIKYAFDSWTPGGALLGVLLVAVVAVIWGKISS